MNEWMNEMNIWNYSKCITFVQLSWDKQNLKFISTMKYSHEKQIEIIPMQYVMYIYQTHSSEQQLLACLLSNFFSSIMQVNSIAFIRSAMNMRNALWNALCTAAHGLESEIHSFDFLGQFKPNWKMRYWHAIMECIFYLKEPIIRRKEIDAWRSDFSVTEMCTC